MRSESIIQIYIASVNLETAQAAKFAFSSDHNYIIQTYLANHFGAYLLVSSSKYEALPPNRRDNDLRGLPMNLR